VATVIKLKRSTTASAVPTTSDLQDGEIAVNITDKKVFMRSGSDIVTVANFNDSSIDLSSISEDVKPSVTETYDLGSPTKRRNELYLAGTTINLGGSTISSDGTGQITISATGATLPGNSNIEVTSGVQKEIALAGETGDPVRSVPFYSKSGGLSAINTRLDFRADPEAVVANFTLANGSRLGSAAGDTLFFL
jgi:hypothetical protein